VDSESKSKTDRIYPIGSRMSSEILEAVGAIGASKNLNDLDYWDYPPFKAMDLLYIGVRDMAKMGRMSESTIMPTKKPMQITSVGSTKRITLFTAISMSFS